MAKALARSQPMTLSTRDFLIDFFTLCGSRYDCDIEFGKISTGVNGSEVGPFDNFPKRLFSRVQLKDWSSFCVHSWSSQWNSI